MEHFFSLSTRLQDQWESSMEYDPDDPFEHDEVELAIPVEEFLVTRWHWEDLCPHVIDKILWITEDTFLLVGGILSEDITISTYFLSLLHANFTETNGLKRTLKRTLTLYKHTYAAVSRGACSVFWGAIERSNIVKLSINSMMPQGESFPSGPILSKFLRGSPLLQRVNFDGFNFGEEHCRAFATIQRKNLKVTLCDCTLDPLDAEGAFIEWFRHNQVVTQLDKCGMGSRVLSALSGNNSVKILSLNGIGQCSEAHIHALTQALPTNQGIVNLILDDFEMSDDTCRLLLQALSTHPRIKVLSIWYGYSWNLTYSAEAKSTMLDAILQMLHRNTVVYTIRLPPGFKNEEVYQNSILPRLEMNRNCFEVQRQAVKRADPSIRPQLLGRALHMVQYNPDLVFRFLSENVPAFVRTEGEEEEEGSGIPLENDLNLVSAQKRKASS
jgi:hypothetical protein